MKRLVLLGASALFLLSACGGDSDSATSPAKSSSADMEVATYEMLPSCAEKREGKTAYVKDQDQGYICQNEKWVESDDAVEVYPSSTSASVEKPSVKMGTLKDSRDGLTYKTVTIGSQTWMAENLNYQVAGSYCYDDNLANCSKYGRLYEYGAAENSCPSGWHLPSKDEWWTLFDLVNKTYPDSATYSLWAKGFKNWPQAFDAFGFSVVPAGIRKSEEDAFRNLGHYRNLDEIAFFQVREPSCNGFCHLVCLSDSCDGTFLANNSHGEGDAISVRCLKDSDDSKSSSNSDNKNSAKMGTLKDSRDGQTYKTVQIGDQVWMAENLNFKTDSSFCYNDSAEYCTKYGRLYKWAAAVGKSENECGYGYVCSLPSGDIQGACPAGWHLPSQGEWEYLITAVGGKRIADKVLMSSSNDGTDVYSFSALPAGERDDKGRYYDAGRFVGSFWSSTESNKENAYRIGSCGDGETCLRDVRKNNGFSIRCLKDNHDLKSLSSSDIKNSIKMGTLKDSRDGQTYKTVTIGSQTWMAQNLNYESANSYCYNDNAANCTKYGRLYAWAAATCVCPEGWHLPAVTEWGSLLNAVGGTSTAVKVLKSSSGWNYNGTDEFSFSALPAGSRRLYGEKYIYNNSESANFWSSTESTVYCSHCNDNSAYGLTLYSYNDNDAYLSDNYKDYGFSVRCLKD